MANAPEEMQDLSGVIGALLINIGTITNNQEMLLAGEYVRVQYGWSITANSRSVGEYKQKTR